MSDNESIKKSTARWPGKGLGKGHRRAVYSGDGSGKGKGDGSGKGKGDGSGKGKGGGSGKGKGDGSQLEKIQRLVHVNHHSQIQDPVAKQGVAVGDLVIVSPLIEITEAKRALIQSLIDDGRPTEEEHTLQFFIDTTDVVFIMKPHSLAQGHQVTIHMSDEVELEVDLTVRRAPITPAHAKCHRRRRWCQLLVFATVLTLTTGM